MRRLLLIIPLIIASIGCTVGRGTSTFPPMADMQAEPPLGTEDDGEDRRILAANGLSETLTLIERTNGMWTVTPDIIPTGEAPSQMVVRDGVVYLVNSLSNSIQVIDPATFTTIREIGTGAGTNPIALAFVDDVTAIVSCYLSNELLLTDLGPETPPEERTLARIPLPSGCDLPHDPGVATNARPGGLAVIGDKCYVACSNLSMLHIAGGPGVLVEVDIPGRSIEATYTLLGRDTTGLLYSPRFPTRLIVMSAGDYLPGEGYKGNGVVESFNLETGEVVQAIEMDGAPLGGAIGPDDILFLENALTGTILRVDLRAGLELPGFPLPSHGMPFSYASAMLALPGLLCATDFNADRLYLVEPVSGEILAELATGDGPDALALLD